MSIKSEPYKFITNTGYIEPEANPEDAIIEGFSDDDDE
jgi:hypothetical protein